MTKHKVKIQSIAGFTCRWNRWWLYIIAILTSHQGEWLVFASCDPRKLCPSFFTDDRLDYVRHIPKYLARMQVLEHSHSTLWNSFVQGEFTVNTNNTIPFTRTAVDQAMEPLNKKAEEVGGISGITSAPDTLLKFCLSAPELAHISNEMEQHAGISPVTRTTLHCLPPPLFQARKMLFDTWSQCRQHAICLQNVPKQKHLTA